MKKTVAGMMIIVLMALSPHLVARDTLNQDTVTAADLSAESFENFRAYGRRQAQASFAGKTRDMPGLQAQTIARIREYASQRAAQATDAFRNGLYNRSRARLPENIEAWRQQPDISNPGPELANFPNSAFTLPQGRAYIELLPFSFYGSARNSAQQFSTEFLLRYGATDNMELRIFGNGITWVGGHVSNWSFSPIAFDTKIFVMAENEEYFLPAMGIEAYLQTQWLGNTATNEGTQPGITFNFDKSLPYEIDLEFNLGTVRVRDYTGENRWQFSFQWALQRSIFDKDFAIFIDGFYDAMTLPRLPGNRFVAGMTPEGNASVAQNAVGAGFLWTLNTRLAIYGQASKGMNEYTPSTISYLGFAVAF